MYISRVTISNFRNFKSLDVNLTSETILVGANRSGKSNFIDAIRLALDPNLPSTVRRDLSIDDFFNMKVTPEGIKISVELSAIDDSDWIGDLDDAQISKNVARFTYWFLTKPQKPLESDDGYSDKKQSDVKNFQYLWYIGADDKKTNKDYRVSSVHLQLISIHMLHALRDANDLLLAKSRSSVNISQLLSELDFDEKMIESILNDLQTSGNRLAQTDEVKNLTDNITNHTAEMVGSFKIQPTLNVITGNQQQLMKAFRLFLEDRELFRASLGESNVLYFALLIEYLRREEVKSKERNYISIVCLEEPEAHIHPHIQRAIFRYFLQTLNSLIITTHSPHLTSVSSLKSLIVFQNTKKLGTISTSIHSLISENKITEGEIADIERYLDVMKSEMVFSKGVIFVEGIAEVFIVSCLFKNRFRFESDKIGISIIAVNGTHFSPFAKLLSPLGLDIPFVIITDGDSLVLYDDDGNLRNKAGSKLPGLARKESIEQALGDLSDKKHEWGVFVGDYTLEIDMILAGYTEESIKSYSSLFVRPTSPENTMRRLVEDVSVNKDIVSMQEILTRIEEKGKGRFAQILSSHLDNRCPTYMAEALDSLVKWVREREENGI